MAVVRKQAAGVQKVPSFLCVRGKSKFKLPAGSQNSKVKIQKWSLLIYNSCAVLGVQ
jgi:hypothetical protein